MGLKVFLPVLRPAGKYRGARVVFVGFLVYLALDSEVFATDLLFDHQYVDGPPALNDAVYSSLCAASTRFAIIDSLWFLSSDVDKPKTSK